jgi:hypothetical protein
LTTRLRLTQLRTTALLCASGLAAEIGVPPRFSEYRRQLEVSTDAGTPEVAASLAGIDGLLALQRGDLADAYARLNAATAGLADISTAAPLKFWGLWAVVAAHQGHWDDTARTRFRQSSAAFRQINTAGQVLADAIGAWRRGEPERGAECYREGLQMCNGRDWWASILALVAWHAAVGER